MSVSLLATKLLFPLARPNAVPRPRLVERLSAGLRGPLTLLSAPAGYGKTTLLSEWRAGIGRDAPAAWLSLDAGDSNLTLFLGYLTAALQTVETGLAANAALLRQSPQQPSLDAILTSLVNDLCALPHDFVLVLDDYHVIENAAVQDAVAFLIAHAPPQMHLAILTREDPPLPLSKLRARGQMVEIREADLRFSAEETASFLMQTMGLDLSREAIADLAERTEGWPAGLQMAGLSLQGTSESEAFIAGFRGEDRYVMDYLMDEVLRGQPEAIQDFLLATSILEQMCAPLCDAVLGSGEPDGASTPTPPTSSQQVLETLERSNLFVVPLDNRREWYRYHALFADLLRYRLRHQHPDHLPALHRRACRWYAQAGNPDAAMAHALAIPDHDLAANLAEQFLVLMTGSSRLSTYIGWIRSLPEDVVHSRAYLCAGCGWAYVLTHQPDLAVHYVEAGEAALSRYEPLSNLPDGREISRREVQGHLLAIRSYAARLQNDLPGAVTHARRALDTLPPDALAVRCTVALNLGILHLDHGDLEPARGAFREAFETARDSGENTYAAISAVSFLGGIAAMEGRLREAEDLFQRAIDYGTSQSGTARPAPGLGLVYGWLVALHYQRNETETAQEHLEKVLVATRQMGDPQMIARAYLYQALLAQSRGEFSACDDWLRRAAQIMQGHPMPELIETEWIVFQGQSHLAQGDLPAAFGLLSAQGVQPADLDGHFPSARERVRSLGPRLGRYLLLARALLAQGAYDRAAELLGKVCTIAEDYPDFPTYLQALLLRAVAASQDRGDVARGLPYLERALNLAAPEGYVRPFLDAGEAIARLLRQAIAQGLQPAYAHTVLAELEEQARRQAGKPRPYAVACQLVEPLTERELQVLRLLAAGLSSTEVAEQLVISVHTARSYVKSIYGKLDAHSRDEAVDRGKQVGLI